MASRHPNTTTEVPVQAVIQDWRLGLLHYGLMFSIFMQQGIELAVPSGLDPCEDAHVHIFIYTLSLLLYLNVMHI